MSSSKKRIAVLLSRSGSTLDAFHKAIKNGTLNATIVAAVSDRPALGLDRAAASGIPSSMISPADFESRAAHEGAIAAALTKYGPDLICLVGYMRILRGPLLSVYGPQDHLDPGRILNIHPALLPAFPGKDPQKQAFDCGVLCTGVTVHFVDKTLDAGPIVAQTTVGISSADTLASLTARLRGIGHLLYPQAAQAVLHSEPTLVGRKVFFRRPEKELR